jgi:hypothetical protein
MNEIDKKLKEKMKLFSEIDNTVNYQLSSNRNGREINLPRKPSNHSFIGDSVGHSKQNNQRMSDNLKPTVNYNSGNNDIYSTKELTEGTRVVSTGGSRNGSSKNCLIKPFVSDVGERLYYQAIQSREKLERRKQYEAEERLKNMTPDITKKAREIKRDPKRFEERLYPSHRIINNSGICGGDRDNSKYYTMDIECSDEDTSRIYKRNPKSKSPDYKFKPALNKNSIQIADKLGPAEQRLLKKKVRSKSCESLSDLSDRSRSKSARKVDQSRLEGLYTKGLTKIKSREVLHREKLDIEENEYKKYTYKPKINEATGVQGKTTPRKQQFPEKAYNWKKGVDLRINRERVIKEKQDIKELTFRPNLGKPIITTDEKFIMKNLSQIENYVGKRRKSIAVQIEQKEYAHKKFHPEENYRQRSTVAKEPNLRTAKLTHNSRSNSPDVSKARKEMRTEGYFKRDTTDDNSQVVSGYNYSFGSNLSSIDDDKHHEFLRAVNNLQEKLLNFKF